MQTSDRRYQELLASMGVRRRTSDRAQRPAGAFFEAGEANAIETEASADRTTRVHVRLIARQVAAKQRDDHAEHEPRPAEVARRVKEILLVDPDLQRLRAVQTVLRVVADVESCADFQDARPRLLSRPPDLLITNLRLKAYNGLHLVHLAAGTPTRSIVYSTSDDLVLAREAQAAGAFFELQLRLPLVLPSYVKATLPRFDRRGLTMRDRRTPVRGGRRCSDLYSACVREFCE